ncbi:MAG: hypothetical protein ABIG63_11600 [Chloroflexota bacterium]
MLKHVFGASPRIHSGGVLSYGEYDVTSSDRRRLTGDRHRMNSMLRETC